MTLRKDVIEEIEEDFSLISSKADMNRVKSILRNFQILLKKYEWGDKETRDEVLEEVGQVLDIVHTEEEKRGWAKK